MIILIEFFICLFVLTFAIYIASGMHKYLNSLKREEESKLRLGANNQLARARYEEMREKIKRTYGEEAWTQAIAGALKDTNDLILKKLENPLNSKNYRNVSRIIKSMGELIEKKEESILDEELEIELELMKNIMAKDFSRKFSRKEVKK